MAGFCLQLLTCRVGSVDRLLLLRGVWCGARSWQLLYRLCYAGRVDPADCGLVCNGCDRRTIQTLYCVVISCEKISSIFITLQAIKVGPKLQVSHNTSYVHIKGEGLGLLKVCDGRTQKKSKIWVESVQSQNSVKLLGLVF